MGATGGSTFWIFGDYAPYVIGHGPMFPAGDALVGYIYPSNIPPVSAGTSSGAPGAPGAPTAPGMTVIPNRR